MTYQNFGRIVKTMVLAPLYVFAAIGRGVEGVRLYETLQRLDDEELADMGLTRSGIAAYVADYMDPDSHRQAADVHTLNTATGEQPTAGQTTEQRRAA